MKKEDLVQLAKNLYRLTVLFPKKEPLRFRIRELADDILSNSIIILNTNPGNPKGLIFDTENNIEVLDSFLEIAKSQNWVSPSEILNLQQEYRNIKGKMKNQIESGAKSEIEEFSEARISPETNFPKENYDIIPIPQLTKDSPKIILEPVLGGQIPSRQEKILTILKEKERLQVKDLKEVFPKVSKRTLRRDFEQLLKKGLVNRAGEKNSTFYQVRQAQI